ncbi:MAG TPA: 1-acyl-sn-glycerol-3-phosphate acyltransferase [Petrimonas sp.]|nr:1-acyl-sn-glycerol-3-phosphate acyltransferase [Petrimonas sp.]
MKIISRFILINVLGWRIEGDFPNIPKSVIIFAPHTSYYDGLYGKLYMMTLGIHYKFLSKKEYFKFPLNLFFKAYGSIPVDKNYNYIRHIVELFGNHSELHILLSPEGQLKRTDRWKKGFYHMATVARVPIVVGYIDYKQKEIGVKGIITNISDYKDTIDTINDLYQGVKGKYPEKFSLDKRFNSPTKDQSITYK